MADIKRSCEAILFTSNEPVSLKRLKETTKVETPKIREAITQLKQEYDKEGRSFQIIDIAGGFQITTRPEYAETIKAFLKKYRTHRLSKSALETVTIIAYRQPITRAEIERLRGVSVEWVLNTLDEKELIRVVGREHKPGAPNLYGTTKEFLRYFGLNKLIDLPKIEGI